MVVIPRCLVNEFSVSREKPFTKQSNIYISVSYNAFSLGKLKYRIRKN